MFYEFARVPAIFAFGVLTMAFSLTDFATACQQPAAQNSGKLSEKKFSEKKSVEKNLAEKKTDDSSSSNKKRMTLNEDGMIVTSESIAMMKRRIEKNPMDYVSMTILGQLLMRDAKESDDHDSYLKAEEAYRDAIRTNDEGASSAKVYLIAALQAQHKFREALEQSEVALKALPGNLVAISGRGDAEMELGNLEAAEKTFQEVADKVQTPGMLARLARIAEIKGRTADAIKLTMQARDKSIEVGERESTTAWYDFRLGMLYFSVGNLDESEASYKRGIASNPDDTRLIDGMAKVLVAKKEYSAAAKLYRRSLDIVEAPPTLAELGDLYRLMDQPEKAKTAWDRAEKMMTEEAKTTGLAHYRERALFLLNHDRQLPLALELAEKDLVNRQDIYTYDTLGWALYKNKKYEEAAKNAEAALKTGVQDASIFYHAGMIAAEAGKRKKAIEYLKKSLDINPYFDVEAAKLAKEARERLSKKTDDAKSSEEKTADEKATTN